jgi:hypothetical protein
MRGRGKTVTDGWALPRRVTGKKKGEGEKLVAGPVRLLGPLRGFGKAGAVEVQSLEERF